MTRRQQAQTQQAHSVEVRRAYERALARTSVCSRYVEMEPGNRVHLLETGAGPPVVLLHGTVDSAGFLLPLLNELDGVRALAPDLPARGLSDPLDLPRHRYRELAVAWLDGLLDSVELDAVALVGHSGGRAVGVVVRTGSPGPGQAARADRCARVAQDSLPTAYPADRHARNGRAAVAVGATEPDGGAAVRGFHGREGDPRHSPGAGRSDGRHGPGLDRRVERQGGDTRLGLAVSVAVALWVPA